MIEIRHEKLNIEKPYRCIVVSDIHSHLDRFKQLLKEARYTTQYYVILIIIYMNLIIIMIFFKNCYINFLKLVKVE